MELINIVPNNKGLAALIDIICRCRRFSDGDQRRGTLGRWGLSTILDKIQINSAAEDFANTLLFELQCSHFFIREKEALFHFLDMLRLEVEDQESQSFLGQILENYENCLHSSSGGTQSKKEKDSSSKIGRDWIRNFDLTEMIGILKKVAEDENGGFHAFTISTEIDCRSFQKYIMERISEDLMHGDSSWNFEKVFFRFYPDDSILPSSFQFSDLNSF